jgi:hypothetical protein
VADAAQQGGQDVTKSTIVIDDQDAPPGTSRRGHRQALQM